MAESINDPKYEIIYGSSYGSMKRCFVSWNEDSEDEPCGFGFASDLLTLGRPILMDFFNKVLKYTDNSEEGKRKWNLAVQDCFGQYYGTLHSKKLNNLNNEELVYLILRCDNYGVTKFSNFSMHDLEVHGIFQNKYLLPCGCHKFYEDECDHK
jgi:hypothetical protein